MIPNATGRDKEITATTLETRGGYSLRRSVRPSTGAEWFTIRYCNGWQAPTTVYGKVFATEAEARVAFSTVEG